MSDNTRTTFTPPLTILFNHQFLEITALTLVNKNNENQTKLNKTRVGENDIQTQQQASWTPQKCRILKILLMKYNM